MEYYLSNKSKKNREGADPRLIAISDLAIQLTLVDFGIPSTGGVRTADEQNVLFVGGKSKCDGFNNLSEHQIKPGAIYGTALDVYAYVEGKASWDDLHLSAVACAHLQAASILGHKLEWGGLWRYFNDKPHFRILD